MSPRAACPRSCRSAGTSHRASNSRTPSISLTRPRALAARQFATRVAAAASAASAQPFHKRALAFGALARERARKLGVAPSHHPVAGGGARHRQPLVLHSAHATPRRSPRKRTVRKLRDSLRRRPGRFCGPSPPGRVSCAAIGSPDHGERVASAAGARRWAGSHASPSRSVRARTRVKADGTRGPKGPRSRAPR